MSSPICSICHRPLSDPFSIALGMGPDCRGKLSRRGWKFPKPKYSIRGGRVLLIGVSGKIERPAANMTNDEEEQEDEE